MLVVCALGLLTWTSALSAQEPAQDPDSGIEAPAQVEAEADAELDATVVEISGVDAGTVDLRLEVTPLRGHAPGELFRLDSPPAADADADADAEDEAPAPIRVEPSVPGGPAMVCVTAAGYALRCERHFFYEPIPEPSVDGEPLRTPEPSDLVVETALVVGPRVVGRVIQDGFAVPGVRIFVVPDLPELERPFTLPLAIQGDDQSASRRFVATDEDGFFETPPLAAAGYRLEIHLPTAQVHRVGPFAVPEPPEGAGPEEADADELEPVRLGEVDVPVGLALEVRVVDQDGAALEGARVTARQGWDPLQWTELRAESDAEGLARMAGLSAESPVVLTCEAPGHGSWREEFELLPVTVDCELPALARIVGVVAVADEELGLLMRQDGEPVVASGPAGVWASARMEGEPGAERVILAPADDAGAFELAGLAPGTWRWTLAAPGFESRTEEVALAAGETLDVGLVYLPAAKSLDGRVVTAENGAPVAGATIRALDPPGLVDTLSDAEGRFTVTASPERPLVLEVAAEDRPAVRVTWDADAQKQGERVVELGRGGWIRVLVGAEDEPCAGCTVRIVAPASARERGGAVPSLETDAGGEALSVPLTPGGYYVLRPRFDVRGTSSVETRDAERRFARVEADEITTVRFDAGGDELRVRLRPVSRLGAGPVGLSVGTPSYTQRAVHEGDGVFRVRRPSSGRVPDLFLLRWNERTRFEDRIYLGPLTRSLGPTSDSGSALAVDSVPGLADRGVYAPSPPDAAPPTVEVELSASVVFGRLETFEDEPVPGVRVRLRSVADDRFLVEARSDAEGVFRVEDAAPGVYSLVLGERAYQFVSVLGGQSVDLGTFQLIPGAY